MTPIKRTAQYTDHDLLVRIDEQLIHLTATVMSNATRTDERLERLAMEKADKAEIGEIKKMLEDKLPKDSFEHNFHPLSDKHKDHEARIRKIEVITYKAIGAWIVIQTAFNGWIAWVTGTVR